MNKPDVIDVMFGVVVAAIVLCMVVPIGIILWRLAMYGQDGGVRIPEIVAAEKGE